MDSANQFQLKCISWSQSSHFQIKNPFVIGSATNPRQFCNTQIFANKLVNNPYPVLFNHA